MDEQLEAKSLAEMMQYQEGSVVSRTLLEKEGGTVTVFAFDQGQGLSEHTAPYDAMVLVLEGAAEVTIAGRTVTVGQGETVIMPAHAPHALTANEKFKMMLIMIKS
ncbi:MAG: cupin domain-containing protein [Anaerolineales bacterium]|nr:cupin domain-containing protein [Anaerolineales bacterium]